MTQGGRKGDRAAGTPHTLFGRATWFPLVFDSIQGATHLILVWFDSHEFAFARFELFPCCLGDFVCCLGDFPCCLGDFVCCLGDFPVWNCLGDLVGCMYRGDLVGCWYLGDLVGWPRWALGDISLSFCPIAVLPSPRCSKLKFKIPEWKNNYTRVLLEISPQILAI